MGFASTLPNSFRCGSAFPQVDCGSFCRQRGFIDCYRTVTGSCSVTLSGRIYGHYPPMASVQPVYHGGAPVYGHGSPVYGHAQYPYAPSVHYG